MTVRVEALTKSFAGGEAAVSDVSFTAEPGEITTLLGPSGSGKSTLLRIIAGLEEPDSGRILLDGVDVTRASPGERGMGFVFQSYALFRHLTVFENVAFGLRVRGAPEKDIERRVGELLALVQLPASGARFPRELSGGQRQRIALARALAVEPRVLLLDEPFGALDARVRVELREWLADLLPNTKMVTLLVTHDQEEAFELSRRVVLLHDGRVAQIGSPEALYDRPATPFVASFVGGVNVFHGSVREGRAEVGGFTTVAPDGVADGARVRAFVRPHDVRVSKVPDEPRRQVATAKVERMTRVGAHVKLALSLGAGGSMTVQMPKQDVDSIGIAPGDRVLVDCRSAQVFVEDYAI